MTIDMLKQLLIDRYYSVELIEKLDPPIEILVNYLWDYIKDNYDKFADDFEINEELYE